MLALSFEFLDPLVRPGCGPLHSQRPASYQNYSPPHPGGTCTDSPFYGNLQGRGSMDPSPHFGTYLVWESDLAMMRQLKMPHQAGPGSTRKLRSELNLRGSGWDDAIAIKIGSRS